MSEPQRLNPPVDFYQRNIAAYNRRYAKDYKRLQAIIEAPCNYQWLPGYEFNLAIERMPPDQPPRIVIIKGIGSLSYIQKMMGSQPFASDTFLYFIVENDPERIAAYFQKAWTEHLTNLSNVYLLFGYDPGTLQAAFFNVLKLNVYSGLMDNALTIETGQNNEPYREYYKQVDEIYTRARNHVYHNYGQIDDSLDGIKATLANKDLLLSCQGIKDLKGLGEGAPALVIGAGPSLDEAIPHIQAIKDKVWLIAVDAALKPLVHAGIEPDFVCGIERENLWQVKFYENMEPLNTTEMVCFPVIHPKVLAEFRGKIRFCYRNYSFYTMFERLWPRGVLRSGGSAGHLATRFAYHIGCNQVGIIACDSAYGLNSEGLVRSHCSNTGYPEWSTYMPIEELMKTRGHLGQPVEIIVNDGSKALTNITYLQWAQEFAEEALSLPFKPLNLSAKGIVMPGLQYVPIKDWAETLAVTSPLNKDKPPSLKRVEVPIDTAITHIKKEFEAHLRCIEQIGALIAEAADSIELTDLHALFLDRHYQDSIYVSYVVQCSAMEAFQLENLWMKLPIDGTGRFEDRKRLLTDKVNLAKLVVRKLLLTLDGKDHRTI